MDRVLNDRGNVRASTVAEVRQAIADLDRQRDQLRMAGRTFLVDVVVQAPPRFCDTVRTALEAELPTLRPGAVRCRFHLLHDNEPSAVAAVLHRLPRWPGVILKAPDLPEIDRAVSHPERDPGSSGSDAGD